MTKPAHYVTDAQTGQPRRKRVLIVDDDVSVREFVQQAVAAGGYDCYAVAPATAYPLLTTWPPEVAILDLMMEPDGTMVAAAVRQANPQARIILYSGKPDMEDVVAVAGAFKADAFLLKPFDLDRLYAVIEGQR